VTISVGDLNSIEMLIGSALAGDTLQGTAGADTFVVTGANVGTVAGTTFQGFENLDGLGGSDTIATGGGNDTFVVNSAGAGIVNGQAFTGIENLDGNGGADTFTFNAALTGTASGGEGDDRFEVNNGGRAGTFDGGAGSDTQTFQNSTGPVTVSVGDLNSIETLVGSGSAADTLQGTPDNDSFSVNAANAGTVAGVAFQGFETLDGMAGDDTFHLLDGSVDGSITGGAGSDEIVGNDAGNIFDVTAADAGTLNSQIFSDVENLTGGAGADTFNLSADLSGNLSAGAGDDTVNVNDNGSAGSMDGGAGNDVVSYAARSAAVTVNTNDAAKIESIFGSGFDDTIILDSSDHGGDLSIDGGAGSDEFIVAASSTIAGDLTVSGVESAAINADVSVTNNVTLSVDGVVTSAGGEISAQSLDVTSIGGQSLDTGIQTYTSSNSGGGNIRLANSGSLDLQDVSQTGGGDISIESDGGSITQSGDISTSGGGIEVTALGGELVMANGTSASSNGGDITYSGGGGDVTIGTLTTCVGLPCTAVDSGVVSVSSTNGDILGNGNDVHITADTAELYSDGDIGSDPNAGGTRVVFNGMLRDDVRISLDFAGTAYVDTRGAKLESTNDNVNDLAELQITTIATEQAASQARRKSVDWAAYSEDVTVYEVNNEGVQLPQDQQVDDFARLIEPKESDATPVPLGQLMDAR